MRLLLDNCIPVDLAPHVRGHDVMVCVELGWDALNDRLLLDAMTGHFDALITVDKGLASQQSIVGRPFAVVVLQARSNRVAHLARLMPALLKALKDVRPGKVYFIAE